MQRSRGVLRSAPDAEPRGPGTLKHDSRRVLACRCAAKTPASHTRASDVPLIQLRRTSAVLYVSPTATAHGCLAAVLGRGCRRRHEGARRLALWRLNTASDTTIPRCVLDGAHASRSEAGGCGRRTAEQRPAAEEVPKRHRSHTLPSARVSRSAPLVGARTVFAAAASRRGRGSHRLRSAVSLRVPPAADRGAPVNRPRAFSTRSAGPRLAQSHGGCARSVDPVETRRAVWRFAYVTGTADLTPPLIRYARLRHDR
jgi:hypothetical protein